MNLKTIISCLLISACAGFAQAVDFDKYFENKTLRIDYTFTGNDRYQAISLDELSSLPSWDGRRVNLQYNHLKGNGQVIVKDLESHETIYTTSFSSLFQEWLVNDEPATRTRSFEHVVLVPFPKKKIEVTISLYDDHQERICKYTSILDPKDILIRQRGIENVTPHKYIHKGGDPAKAIDVAILAEGYTESEMDIFYADAAATFESFMNHEPFKSMKDRFNFVAVAAPSRDSGVSVPKDGLWKSTVCGSHFSTFYSDRYLTTLHVKDVHNALAGVPYEHIIILANTEEYGGGGIYNSYTLTTAHHPKFKPVVVHEFGHSFGGLADEYFYEGDQLATNSYPAGVEPWEPNITTMVNLDAKWKSMLKKGTPIPTPATDWQKYPVGVFEGAGYCTYGVYRPADRCRMRDNEWSGFCPVCQKALKDLIIYYTEE